MDDDPLVLRARDVTFGYKRRHPILKKLDLDVHAGEIVGISGENGSGKSTFLKAIVGLIRPQSGGIRMRGRIGYSPQEALLFEHLTVVENFEVFGRGAGIAKSEIVQDAKRLMKRLHFEKYAFSKVGELSGGTAQKLNFAISLLGSPEILILDEPYQGMDHASYVAFWEMQQELREEGKAIVVVSHLIEDKQRFSRTLHLVDGRLQGCLQKRCPHCGEGRV